MMFPLLSFSSDVKTPTKVPLLFLAIEDIGEGTDRCFMLSGVRGDEGSVELASFSESAAVSGTGAGDL